MNKKTTYPKCEQRRHDCFSCDEIGRCHCLSDTKEAHLSRKTNRKIKIRTAYMNDEKQHYMFSVKLERNEYLIAEER